MRNIYITFLTLVLLFNISCSDYLDRYPLDAPSNATFLSNEEEMKLGMERWKEIGIGDF